MSNPEKMIYVPFATNGQRNDILVTNPSTAAVQDASFTYGFPNATLTPKASGGKPPNGKDMNGILYAITTDTVHRQSGKQIQYDATYATNIGGYAKGSIVQSTDLTKSYISTADGNLTDPDSSSSKNWNVYSQPPLATSTTVGTVKIADTLNSTAKDTALTANQGNVLANMLLGVQGGSGYQWMGKTLIQWSNEEGKEGDKFSFPIPFPNNFFGAIVVDREGSSNAGYSKSQSTNSYLYLGTTAPKLTFTYFAIGN